MGLRETPSADLIDADWITPSSLGYTSVIRSVLFSCRRNDSSISHNRSAIFNTSSVSVAHFDRHSTWEDILSPILSDHLIVWLSHFVHLLAVHVSNWIWHQGLHYHKSSRQKMIGHWCCQILWIMLTGVKGLAFSVGSTKHIVILNTGNVRRRHPRNANIAFLEIRTSLS